MEDRGTNVIIAGKAMREILSKRAASMRQANRDKILRSGSQPSTNLFSQGHLCFGTVATVSALLKSSRRLRGKGQIDDGEIQAKLLESSPPPREF